MDRRPSLRCNSGPIPTVPEAGKPRQEREVNGHRQVVPRVRHRSPAARERALAIGQRPRPRRRAANGATGERFAL